MKKKAKIFIAMPFDKELDNVNYVISQYGYNKGYDVWRADRNQVTAEIFSHITGKIAESDVIIADVTYENPNVFFEIGYSWALGKEILLIAESLENLPFDIRGHSVFPYNDRRSAKDIEAALSKNIDAAVSNSLSKSHLTFEVLQIAQKIARSEDKNHIYYKLLESQIHRVSDEIDLWLRGSMQVNRDALISKGIEVFDTINKGGFATFLAPLEGYWEENNEYVLKSREVARDASRNLFMERVYILSSISSITSRQLLDNIKDDEASNIHTYVVFKDELGKHSIRDFGIWDEGVVCIINIKENLGRGYEVLGGKFSKLPQDLSEYDSYRRDIKRSAILGADVIREVSELSASKQSLLQTALDMENLSDLHCEGGYMSEKSCCWYHSAWQYLRLIDMVSTPSWHNDFYSGNLSKYIGGSPEGIRILISGTADYGMLEQISKLPDAKKIEEVLIIDLCSTPLQICEEYHKNHLKGVVRFNKLRQDIRQTTIADESYDVIMTDAFLSRFSNQERISVISEWHRLLKPGGVVLTTIRIESIPEGQTCIKSSDSDVNRYKRKVETKINSSGVLMRHMHNKIVTKATEYAREIISYPVCSELEVRELFKEYECETHLHTVVGEIKENTLYAQVVAKKSNKEN